MWKKITKWFVPIWAGILIIYATVVFFTPEENDQVSVYLRDLVLVKDLWVIPFFIMAPVGHWFINKYRTKDDISYPKLRLATLILIGILALLSDVIIESFHVPWYISIPAGLFVGAYLWPLPRK